MRVKILKRCWDLIYDSKLRNWGKCDPPNTPKKQIRIKPGLSQKNELDTVIHEILHAADESERWAENEEWVNQVATDAAGILWRMGWRKVEPGSGA